MTASPTAAVPSGPRITHYGTVAFDFGSGLYSRESGSSNWSVRPVDWPGVPGPPPLGQVLIQFMPPRADARYTVVVSPRRVADAPMIAANYGDADKRASLSYCSIRSLRASTRPCATATSRLSS